MIITHQQCRNAGLCNRGMRKWALDKGLDWNSFVFNGLDSEILLSMGDSRVQKVIDLANKSVEDKNNGKG